MAWKTLAIDESAFTQLMQLFTGVPVLNTQFTAIAVSSCIAAYASNQWKKVLGRATKGGGRVLLSSHRHDSEQFVNDEDI